MGFNRYEICVRDKSKLSGFECDIETIKGYLCDIGNTYLLIAYRVYEMDLHKSYKGKYKNLVEACEQCLGWKKSTTYNMLNIVKRFGTPNEHGIISYDSLFGSSRFSYSQLCEMLSLSDKQLEQVTPDTTVKEIREMKKQAFQTSGKKEAVEVIDVVDFVIAENGIEEAPESTKVEQPVLSEGLGSAIAYKASRDFYLKAYTEIRKENQQLRTDRANAISRADNVERELDKLRRSLDKPEYVAFEKESEGYYELYLEEGQAKALLRFINLNISSSQSDYKTINSIRLAFRDVLSQEGSL